MTDNPFEEYGREGTAARRRKDARHEARLNKVRDVGEIQRMRWLKWHHEKRQELMCGSYSAHIGQLADFLETMTLDDGEALIELVQEHKYWQADPDTRYGVIRMIDYAIMHLCVSNGLPPIDDALPGEDPKVFQIVKELIEIEEGII